MARFLQQLLNAPEPAFTTTLRRLETMTGSQGIDVSYIANITKRAHDLMRRIGLDPADTTDIELYRALNANAKNSDLFADTADVGLSYAGRVVSFNIDDILENISLTYEMRRSDHLRCQLQHTLMERYLAAKVTEKRPVEEMFLQMGLGKCDMEDYHQQKIQGLLSSQVVAPSILCIGDIFTDTFIKLLENQARIDTDNDGSKRLSIPFGSKPPYERADVIHSVGPSPNAAVACARLGLKVSLMSWLGDDQVGKDSLKYLLNEHIGTSSVVSQNKTASNSYYVLRYGADRTILVKNEDYDYRWRAPSVTPDWIYLSLISADSWHLHQDLLEYLEANSDIKLAFQPGTFHFQWGTEKLSKMYKRSYIVIMNREEAADVTGLSVESPGELTSGLHKLGPKIVVITDGPNGSYASHDGKIYRIPNYPDLAPPLDRTGAGDAFASTIVSALALGNSIDVALTWAPINSMSVVQQLGAQAGLLDKKVLQNFLKEAPDWYRIEEMTK